MQDPQEPEDLIEYGGYDVDGEYDDDDEYDEDGEYDGHGEDSEELRRLKVLKLPIKVTFSHWNVETSGRSDRHVGS